MSTVPVPAVIRQALSTNKALRNGNFYPDANNHRFLIEECNRIAAYRVKELCSFSCPISAIPGVDTVSRPRWRAYVHTSPFAKYLYANFVMAKSPNLTIAGAVINASGDPYAQLLVELTNGTDIGTSKRHYGVIWDDLNHVTDVPSNFDFSRIKLSTTITGDTDYLLTFSDEQGARLVAGEVYEVCKELDTSNGYIDSTAIVGDAPILDAQLASQLSILRNAWKRGAAHLLNFSSNTDATAPTNATTTEKNIIDNATTVSGATPGWTIDLTNRSTVRRASTGVPVRWRFFGKVSAGTGTIKIKDSTGATVASSTITSTTAAWQNPSDFNLPATSAKYDVHFSCSGGTFTLYAVSLFQYEA